MQTLFHREEAPPRMESTPQVVILYAAVAALWVSMAFDNFHRHNHRGWLQFVAGLLYFVVCLIHFLKWRRSRKAESGA